jgi:hypothetical protein
MNLQTVLGQSSQILVESLGKGSARFQGLWGNPRGRVLLRSLPGTLRELSKQDDSQWSEFMPQP